MKKNFYGWFMLLIGVLEVIFVFVIKTTAVTGKLADILAIFQMLIGILIILVSIFYYKQRNKKEKL